MGLPLVTAGAALAPGFSAAGKAPENTDDRNEDKTDDTQTPAETPLYKQDLTVVTLGAAVNTRYGLPLGNGDVYGLHRRCLLRNAGETVAADRAEIAGAFRTAAGTASAGGAGRKSAAAVGAKSAFRIAGDLCFTV